MREDPVPAEMEDVVKIGEATYMRGYLLVEFAKAALSGLTGSETLLNGSVELEKRGDRPAEVGMARMAVEIAEATIKELESR